MGRFKLNKFDIWKTAKRSIYGLLSTASALIVVYPGAVEHIADRVLPISIASGVAQAIITLAKNFAWDDHSSKTEEK